MAMRLLKYILLWLCPLVAAAAVPDFRGTTNIIDGMKGPETPGRFNGWLSWSNYSGNPVMVPDPATNGHNSLLRDFQLFRATRPSGGATYWAVYSMSTNIDIWSWEIGIAWSSDGYTWAKSTTPIIKTNATASWWSGSVFSPAAYYDTNADELYLYVSGSTNTGNFAGSYKANIGVFKASSNANWTSAASYTIQNAGAPILSSDTDIQTWEGWAGVYAPAMVKRVDGVYNLYYSSSRGTNAVAGYSHKPWAVGVATSTSLTNGFVKSRTNPQFGSTNILAEEPCVIKLAGGGYIASSDTTAASARNYNPIWSCNNSNGIGNWVWNCFGAMTNGFTNTVICSSDLLQLADGTIYMLYGSTTNSGALKPYQMCVATFRINTTPFPVERLGVGGLVAEYALIESNNPVFRDTSGNGFHLHQAGTQDYVAGVFSNTIANQFATNTIGLAGCSGPTRLIASADEVSATFWMKNTNVIRTNYSKVISANSGNELSLFLNVPRTDFPLIQGSMSFGFSVDNGNMAIPTTTGGLYTGTNTAMDAWTFFSFRYSGKLGKGSVQSNAVSIATNLLAGGTFKFVENLYNPPLCLGWDANAPGLVLPVGISMQGFRLYNKWISDQTVMKDYNWGMGR